MLYVVGCTSGPARTAYNAHAGYNAALATAIEARKAGKLSDAAYWRFETARAMAAAGLATIDQAAAAGVTPDPAVLKDINAAIQTMGATQ